MATKQSLTTRILRGSLTVVVLTSLTPPISYLIKILYSRTLSIETFGLFYAVLAFFLLLSSFTDLGFGYAVSYLIPKYFKKKKYQECWDLYKYNQIVNLVTSVIVSIVVGILASFLSNNYFKIPGSEFMVHIFIIYLIGNGLLSSLDKLFLGLQQEKYYSLTQTVRIFLALSFSALIWFSKNATVVNYAATWAVATAATAVIFNTIMLKKNPQLSKHMTWNPGLFRQMFHYAIPNFATTLLYILITSMDVILLTSLKGVKEVGIYTVVYPIATMSSIILAPINTFFIPLISHLMEGEKEKVQKIIYSALEIIPFVGLYFAFFVILFPSQPVSILFGSKWIDLVKTPLMILSLVFIGTQTSNFLATIIVGMGAVKERMRASILIALVNVSVSYFLISRYSVVGASLASFVTFLISMYLYTKIIRKTLQIKFPVALYAKLITICSIIYIFVKVSNVQPSGIFQYLLAGVFYTLIMGIVAYMLKLFDKNMLKSLLEV